MRLQYAACQYIHQPSEVKQIVFFGRLDLYHKSPDSGELPYIETCLLTGAVANDLRFIPRFMCVSVQTHM